MIDLALHSYFEVDRYLARGDVFSICIKWNCKSTICVPCNQSLENGVDNTIYFKVVAMEPLDEPILRVNRSQTALVLGGSVSSAVPPDLLISGQKGFTPLQGDTVKILASILTPLLCPSALSSKFRVSVLLYGLAGCGKRTVVRYIAHRLGLHVVEYSCHNLTTSSEKKMSVALAQTLNAAQRYSPAILLLRHFDVFRNLHEGPPNDQVGITSEVASLIREFTEPISDYGDIDSEQKQNGHVVRSIEIVALASVSVERRLFVWKISEGPDEEGTPQITGKIVIAIQIVGEGEAVHPRVCWHCHKQVQFHVVLSKIDLNVIMFNAGQWSIQLYPKFHIPQHKKIKCCLSWNCDELLLLLK